MKNCSIRIAGSRDSGVSGDTREIIPQARSGNARAKLALDVFVHRLRAGIGQMLASLEGRPDAIVFTDAISESEPDIIAGACQPFDFIGLCLDPAKIRADENNDRTISRDDSAVKALIIKSRESWQIACECYSVAEKAKT